MSVLLGIELERAWVRLVVVDRRAQVVARRAEPLSSPVERWWETHPEERHRAVIGLIASAVQAGELRPAEVAAIGISAAPALAFLDPDFAPVPPRELPIESADPARHAGRPWRALAALLAAEPAVARRIGAVLDLVGYIRFRLSGSLGIDLDFAWRGGHIRSPLDPASWSVPSLDRIGLPVAKLPPIFPASQRVSVIGEETIASTGLRRGTWVSGGGDPIATRLLFAGEPLGGRSVVRLLPGSAERWEAGAPPLEWSEDSLPTALEGVFFHRRPAEGWDPRTGALLPGSEETIFDWEPGEWASEGEPEGPGAARGADPGDRPPPAGDTREAGGPPVGFEVSTGPDLSACPGSILIAPDAGESSAGTAILAGLGIGWWRDPRPIFRKRRPPRPLEERRAATAMEGAEEEQGAASE